MKSFLRFRSFTQLTVGSNGTILILRAGLYLTTEGYVRPIIGLT